MIDRERPNAAQRWGPSPMTRLNATQGAGSSSWRLAAGGATTHHRPLEGGYPENSGLFAFNILCHSGTGHARA